MNIILISYWQNVNYYSQIHRILSEYCVCAYCVSIIARCYLPYIQHLIRYKNFLLFHFYSKLFQVEFESFLSFRTVKRYFHHLSITFTSNMTSLNVWEHLIVQVHNRIVIMTWLNLDFFLVWHHYLQLISRLCHWGIESIVSEDSIWIAISTNCWH